VIRVIIDFDGTLTAEETQARALADRSLDTLADEIIGAPRAQLAADYDATQARLLAAPHRYWWEVNGLIASAWVGIGPFAGVLALAANNIPNLGKLFSESIEEIDPGPVEAVTATGASRLQVLSYAFVPQIVPKFLAFILYQWDINIRMSTVIGYVGGGGIGQFFRINVQLNQYDAAGMAVWAIVVMVWSMDYLSAKARERLA